MQIKGKINSNVSRSISLYSPIFTLELASLQPIPLRDFPCKMIARDAKESEKEEKSNDIILVVIERWNPDRSGFLRSGSKEEQPSSSRNPSEIYIANKVAANRQGNKLPASERASEKGSSEKKNMAILNGPEGQLRTDR